MHVLVVCALTVRLHLVTNLLQLADVRPISTQVLYSFYLAACPTEENAGNVLQ